LSGRNEITVSSQQLRVLVDGRIAHQITDRAMPNQAGVIQVLPTLDTDQVGYLRRVTRIRALANAQSGQNCRSRGDVFLERIDRR
jgi:hypothetical protein